MKSLTVWTAVLGFTIALLSLASCSRKTDLPRLTEADSLRIVTENLAHRESAESFFSSDPGSPFLRDTTITFTGIKWFPIDPRFVVHSELHRYEVPETVSVFGTQGEERRQLRYGYFEFMVPGDDGQPVTIRLNVYKFTPQDRRRFELYPKHLSVWFTDRTTGVETYHVGRYLEVGEEQPDPHHVYEIDLNKAYNPYCAYSDTYSCAIPKEEDHVDVAIRAGEMTYKDESHTL